MKYCDKFETVLMHLDNMGVADLKRIVVKVKDIESIMEYDAGIVIYSKNTVIKTKESLITIMKYIREHPDSYMYFDAEAKESK